MFPGIKFNTPKWFCCAHFRKYPSVSIEGMSVDFSYLYEKLQAIFGPKAWWTMLERMLKALMMFDEVCCE